MEIFENLQTISVAKGTILLQKGDFCKFTFKVIKGCLKSYVIDKSGKVHVLHFAAEDWIISDMDSFIHNKPATIYIDAIEDSEVALITQSDYSNLRQKGQDVLVELNQKLMKNIIAANKRLANLLSASSEERYADFIETYPTLMQRIPLKLIASYLGMTPEYLSEIRRKYAQK